MIKNKNNINQKLNSITTDLEDKKEKVINKINK